MNSYKGFIEEREDDSCVNIAVDDRRIFYDIPNFFKVSCPSKGKLISRLKRAYCQGKLTVVLGSGISYEHGLPKWSELILEAMIKTFSLATDKDDVIREFSNLYISRYLSNPLIAVRHIWCLMQNVSKDEKMNDLLRDVLYSRASFSDESDFYKVVANMCASIRKIGRLDSVVTYNYDDLLEVYLDSLTVKVPYRVITDGDCYMNDNGELNIYHVHGYLPKKRRGRKILNIVFDEEQYNDIYNNAFYWSNVVQIEKFTSNICLFVGLSMEDPNLRRLLDAAKNNHNRKKERYHVVVLKKSNFCKYDSSKDSYNGALQEMYEKGKMLEMRSLNCDVYFVSDFDEIPNFLEKIIN